MKVKLFSFLYKPFDRYIEPWHRVFCYILLFKMLYAHTNHISKIKIHSLMNKYIPSKQLHGNKKQKTWVSREVKTVIRKRDKLFKKQRRTKRSKDIRNYKETKARLQKAERQSYWNCVDHIIDEGEPGQEHHPKQKRFWSFIKSMRKDTSGRLQSEPRVKADILNRQYESTWTKEDRSSIHTPEGQPFPAMPEISVTKEGVFKPKCGSRGGTGGPDPPPLENHKLYGFL